MNPFISFCLYVAARVFVQYLKSRKDDSTVKSSLQFLLSAMQALRTKNPLTESFLVQLDVDLEGSGLDIQFPSKLGLSRAMVSVRTGVSKCMLTEGQGEVPINTDSVKCSPLFEIRQSQTQGQNGGIQTSIEKPLLTTTDMPMDFSNITTFETAAIPQRPRVSPRP